MPAIMDFEGLLKTVRGFQFYETRSDQPNYFEAVLAKNYLKTLYPALEKFFGAPVQANEGNRSKRANDFAELYGGIRKGQTLYFAEEPQFTYFAFLWPWQATELVTLKIIKEKNRP